MHDRKRLSLAAELRRNLRAEFPAAARLSVSDPDFMEAILDYAGRSLSNMVQAAALTLRSQLEGTGYLQPASLREEGPQGASQAAHKRRVYRGRVIEDPEENLILGCGGSPKGFAHAAFWRHSGFCPESPHGRAVSRDRAPRYGSPAGRRRP